MTLSDSFVKTSLQKSFTTKEIIKKPPKVKLHKALYYPKKLTETN
jgi:hypothetical protein